MATIDEQIQLAERIAERLPEVSRNEWMRWMEIATRYGLERAIPHAQQLGRDVSLRPNPRRANGQIAQVLRKYHQTLLGMDLAARRTTLGYVGWWLRILERETGKPSEEQPQRRREGAQPQRPSRPRR